MPSPHARTHTPPNGDRGACFSAFPGPDTARLPWFRWCPGSHPCSWFPASQSPCKHRPTAWEKPEAPLPGPRSAPILPCTSQCPPGPCTRRHGLIPPPQAGLSASRGTCPVQQPSFRKGLSAFLPVSWLSHLLMGFGFFVCRSRRHGTAKPLQDGGACTFGNDGFLGAGGLAVDVEQHIQLRQPG